MAFTSIAALVAGEAATTTLVLGAIAEVGMAMTVVGAVTGNKTLMKVGGVMGLVGGVGGMINGMSSGATGALGEAATGEALDAASKEAMAAYGGEAGAEASQLAGIAEMGGDTAGLAGEAGFNSMVDDAIKSLGDNATTVADTTSPTADAVADAAKTAAPEAPVGPTPTTPESPSLIGEPTPTTPTMTVEPTPTAPTITPPTQLPPAGSKDYFGNFMKWVKNNKEVANGVLKLGGEALKGMSEADAMDQKLEIERGKTQYGNTVARYNPQPLIGARA